jgi:hypothetical protein
VGTEVLLVEIELARPAVLADETVELDDEHGLPHQLLERVGPVEAIHAVGPNHSVLELHQLLVRTGRSIGAQKQPCLLNREVSEGLNLLHEGLLVPLELELHVDLRVVNRILLPEVVLVDQRHRVAVLLRELALPGHLLVLLHQVHAEEDTPVATDQVVEVLASPHAHVVHVGAH